MTVSKQGQPSFNKTELGDIVAITEYKNGVFSCDSFINILHKYLDTASAALPITVVTFVGQPKGDELPKSHADNSNELDKRRIITFGFNKTKTGCDISLIGIFKKSENLPLLFQKDLPGGKSAIDSIIHSKRPID